MNQTPQQPSSIHALALSTVGGTPARTGFNLQDQVAATYCIQMLSTPSLAEVWCEAHDDIILLHSTSIGEEVEFVQVKDEDPDQLWSLARLCQGDSAAKTKAGTSILERSLAQHRCSEPCKFRIVTSRDIKSDLSPLTHPLDSPERAACKAAIEALVSEAEKKINGFLSPNGAGCGFWFQRACWEVVYTVEAVEDHNLITLARALEQLGIFLLADQIAELYKKVVRLTFDAALSKTSEGKKLKRAIVLQFIGKHGQALVHPAPVSGTRVAEKMQAASLTAEAIDAANRTRHLYRQAVLTDKYSAPKEYNRVEGEVVARLSSLLNKLDSGDLADTGPQFHTRCHNKLEELLETNSTAKQLGLAFLQGCMYNITDRCSHRFLRVSA
jgi:hypothetical protein